MLQAGKSASTTRWARRASSASALDSPVPDIPVIRTRVSPSKLPRPLQTDRTWSASSPGEASHKHPAQYSAQGSSCGAPHQLGKFASKCRIGESNTWACQQPDDLDALRIEAPLNVGASAAWSGDDGGSHRHP